MKYGFEHEPHVQSGLIYMYAGLSGLAACHWMSSLIREPDLVCQSAIVNARVKMGDFAFAWKLFDKMPHKDPIVWNAMISRYVQCGQSRKVSSYIQLNAKAGRYLRGKNF